MKKRAMLLTALLLVFAMLLSACGEAAPADGDATTTTTTVADGDGTTTTDAVADDTTTTTESTTTTTTTTAATTTTTQPLLPPVDPATYRALDVLLDQLQEGEVAEDAVWKPVFLDANCISGWKELYPVTETFAHKLGIDFSMPFVYPSADVNGVVLNANQWASGGVYWDKAGVAFYSPGRCTAVLRASDVNGKIAAAVDSSANALTKTEGRVEIYLNDELIWPTNADFAVVTAGKSLDFPEIELDLYPGDVVVIAAYGAMPGEDIRADTGGTWENHVLLDPVIEIK